MLNFGNSDKKSGFVVGTAGVTVLTMAALVFKQILKFFTSRKDTPVANYGLGDFVSSKTATLSGGPSTPAPVRTPLHQPPPQPSPLSALDSGVITDETSPIDPSEDTARLTMLASEAVLLKDWESPEEDEAWAHL